MRVASIWGQVRCSDVVGEMGTVSDIPLQLGISMGAFMNSAVSLNAVLTPVLLRNNFHSGIFCLLCGCNSSVKWSRVLHGGREAVVTKVCLFPFLPRFGGPKYLCRMWSRISISTDFGIEGANIFAFVMCSYIFLSARAECLCTHMISHQRAH